MACTATDLVYETACNEPVDIAIDPLGVCPGATLLPKSSDTNVDPALGSPVPDEGMQGPAGSVSRVDSTTIRYTPPKDWVGRFVFTYTITNNTDPPSTGRVFVTVNGDVCHFYHAVRCVDSPEDEGIWVKLDRPPGETIVFLYEGECYTLDKCPRCKPDDVDAIELPSDQVDDCDAEECEPTCPTDCSSCPAAKTVVISGGTAIDGMYTVDDNPVAPCVFFNISPALTLQCFAGIGWRFTFGGPGTELVVAEKSTVGACPPNGSYTTTYQSPLIGGTAVVTVS